MTLKIKISNVTLCWAAFIIISSSFMRTVLNFAVNHVAITGVSIMLWALFAVSLTIALFCMVTIRSTLPGVIMFLAVFCCGVYFASQMKIVEERWHILQFGLLAFLVMRDSDEMTNNFHRSILAVSIGFFVASLDESFQFILPNRVADVRDIFSGTAGSIWGSLLYLPFVKKIKEDI